LIEGTVHIRYLQASESETVQGADIPAFNQNAIFKLRADFFPGSIIPDMDILYFPVFLVEQPEG
jgi:hypothetical protein